MDEQERLVCRMQEGDVEAFDRIFELYQRKLLRTAYLITGNYADSEDIVQETFVKCFCNCKKLREPAGFTTWLYQILTRTALHLLIRAGKLEKGSFFLTKKRRQSIKLFALPVFISD